MAQENNFNVKVSTTGLTLFNEDGIMLKLSYLDDSLSIVFGYPDEVNGKRSYPQEKRYPLIITNDRAAILYDDVICNKLIDPITQLRELIEEGDEEKIKEFHYAVGVFTSKREDAIFQIRIENGRIHCIFLKDIDENQVPKNSYVFTFARQKEIEGFDTAEKNFKINYVEAQYLLFTKYIKGFLNEGANASTHSFRHANKYMTDKLFREVEAVMTKLGISIESTSGYQKPYNQSFNNNKGDQGFVATSYSSEVTTLDGMIN